MLVSKLKEPLARKTENRTKVKYHHHKHGGYERILDAMRDQYLNESEPDRLAVPYILMCATTLEARMNDELHDHAYKMWGDKYKTIADAYFSMTFRGKLNALVPILTNGRYRINRDHFVYQRLVSLISVRNLIAHPKPTVGEFEEFELEEGETWPFTYPRIPAEIIEKLTDITMESTKSFTPVEYHEAIEKLEKWFFHRCPDRLSKIAMVVARVDA